jgi:ABC-type Mn2+/Zn2+ transport system ATPase subunit
MASEKKTKPTNTDKNTLALQVKNLSVELNGQKIIENLTFAVKKGETLVILGPNGAGKTTLLRALLGIVPHQGEVSWAIKNISYLPPKELLKRKEILPLTVEDFYSLKEIAKSKALENLESVGLASDVFEKRIAHLSTGQFQRLSVGWALVDNPDTLLFDEPTSGIDIGGTETIYSLLHGFWKKRQLTIILVTHELSVVWEHADHVLCLNKKGVCYGAPAQVLSTENLKKLYGVGVKYYKHAKQ